MGSDRKYWEGVKDVTEEDRKLAAELEKTERERGIPHPQEETKKK
jgi:hypothetical protein